jgi:hypothetical protein
MKKESNNITLRPEQRFILMAADIRPDDEVLKSIDDMLLKITDWEYFTSIAIDKASSPLIVDKISFLNNANVIPQTVLIRLNQAALKTLTRNMVLTEHFRQIVKSFSDIGIPVIALKGSFLSHWLYQNIGLRQFSDLDLLVPENDGLRAIEALRLMGYNGETNNPLHLSEITHNHLGIVHYSPMHKNGVSVEIHIRITGRNETYKVDLEGMRKRAMLFHIHDVDVFGFCPNDLLMHLCLHLDKHFVVGSVQFTCFYDLTNLLNHKTGEINWDEFEKECIKCKAVNFTFKYLLLVNKYMNAFLPEMIISKYNYCLKPSHERMFLHLFDGNKERYGLISDLKSLRGFNNPMHLLHYIIERLFPSKAFMICRYKIKNENIFFLYYPVRWAFFFKSFWIHYRRIS